MNNNPKSSLKKLAGLEHKRVRSASGLDQENYVLTWQDGSKTEYSSLEELPERYQKIVRELKKKTANESARFNTSPIIDRSPQKRRRGGNRFRLHWRAEPDKLVILWPTLGHVGSWGCLSIIAALFCSIDFYEPFTYWSKYPGISLGVVIALATLGILALASAFVLEERFEIHSNRVTLTRWPAFLRPTRVRPRKDLINARVVLRRRAGKSRNTSSVYIRVRTPQGIDWWELGGMMTRGNARSLGDVLKYYVELDKEDHQKDDLVLTIPLWPAKKP